MMLVYNYVINTF